MILFRLFSKACLLGRALPFFFPALPAAQAQGQPVYHQLRGQVAANTADASNVAVSLLRDRDSSLIKVEFPDKEGAFLFERLPEDTYRILASHLQYQPYRSGPIPLQADTDLGVLTLEVRSSTLREVAVTAAQPLIRRQLDRTVLNVAGSITAAGSTALELLQKAPGVAVDQADNISMRGRQGVLVMIDGKRQFISGAELALLLRATPAAAIDRIELITNPSAKYDAQGSAGIIDIRLKKDTRYGTNGTLTASYGQGQYSRFAAGSALNHRTKTWNLSGSYNYNYRGDYNDLRLQRNFYNGGIFGGAYDQQNLFVYRNNSHVARAGADYTLSPKTTIGIVANSTEVAAHRTTDNQSGVYDAANVYAASFRTTGANTSARSNQTVNLNLQQQLALPGSELTADLDYARYGSRDDQNYTTLYSDAGGRLTRDPYLLHGDLTGSLNIWSAKADCSTPLAKGVKFETGVKSSWVTADNDLQFRDQSNGGSVLDTTKSNHFLYDENINAAYANASGAIKKLDWQLGLRVENTNARGRQLTDGTRFDRAYTQLFPSGVIGYRFNERQELNLSVSRRINRPTYNQLNPFKYFLDPSTYATGNPYLVPELSTSFELTHLYRQKFQTQLAYARTTNNTINTLFPDPKQKNVVVQTDLNAGSLDYYSLGLTAPFAIGKWLTSSNTVTFYYAHFQGEAASTRLNAGRVSFNCNSTSSLTLGGGYSAEVTGVYQSTEVYGFFSQQPLGYLTLGVQKQLLNKAANLKLAVADVFRTARTRAVTEVTGYEEQFYQQRDTRYATLSFTYRFGRNQVAPARRRVGGAEDEKRRAS